MALTPFPKFAVAVVSPSSRLALRSPDEYPRPCRSQYRAPWSSILLATFPGVLRQVHAPVNKPSRGALLLGLIPFGAMCFSVPLWDRVDPTILGIPFNLFWLTSWIVLTPACLWAAYRIETARNKPGGTVP
jgi:Protein of unknown function (DUF3311)